MEEENKKEEKSIFCFLLDRVKGFSKVEKRLLAAIAILLLTALGFGIFLLAEYPPESTPLYPECFFRSLTGFSCVGCGSTRSLSALFRGEFLRAFTLNPILYLGGLAGGILLFFPRKIFFEKWFWIGFLLTVLGYTISRNLFGF